MQLKRFLTASAISLALATSSFAGNGQTDIRSDGTSTLIISLPGHYVLVDDITMTVDFSAIRILADNVVLDLNGHTLTGTGSGSSAHGILSSGDSTTVKNGHVENFGGSGVLSASRLQDVHIKDIGLASIGSTYAIAFSDGIVEGCSVDGASGDGIICYDNGVIRDCVVRDCGDAGIRTNQQTLIENCFVTECGTRSPIGAFYIGTDTSVKNCTISNNSTPGNPVPPNETNYQIRVVGAGCVIEGNTISNASSSGTGAIYGIYSQSPLIIRGNTFVNLVAEGTGSATGIYVSSTDTGAVIESNHVSAIQAQSGIARGIWANKSTVINNTSTANGTLADGGYAYGIIGSQSLIEGNTVQRNFTTTSGSGIVYGISALYSTIRNNSVAYNQAAGTGGNTYGIQSTLESLIEDNHVHDNNGKGTDDSVGIYCGSACVVQGNLVRDHTGGSGDRYGIYLGSPNSYVTENVTMGNTSAGIAAIVVGNRIERNRSADTTGVLAVAGTSLGTGDLANITY